MPKIFIYTKNSEAVTSRDTYVSADVTITKDGQYLMSKNIAEIKVRGNTTSMPPKKAYRLRFEKKTSVLGLNDSAECRNWCLLTDWYDYSFLRNYAALNIGRVLLGDKYFVPDCIHVELYLNGDYRGVYLLTDKVQINKDRVDITKKEDGATRTDIGYLLTCQGGRTDEPDSVFVSPNITVTDKFGASRNVGSLNFSLIGSGYTREQRNYAGTYLRNVYKVVAKAVYDGEYYSIDGVNTLTEMSFPEGTSPEDMQKAAIGGVINIDSFARCAVMEEFVKDFDIGASYNLYFDAAKGADRRVSMAAPWDYDFSLGNVNTLSTMPWSGWFSSVFDVNERYNPMLIMLDTLKWFRDMERDIWNENKAGIIDVMNDVLNEGRRYETIYEKDYKKWGRPQMDRTDLHSYGHHAYFTAHDDATLFLYDWMVHRFNWLDDNYNNIYDICLQ